MKYIFITYFPIYTDIHLFKDPGQLPFRFNKNFDYESYIINTITNGNCEESKKYLKIFTLPKSKFGRYKKLVLFFIKNRQRIKIFNIFGISFHNLVITTLCKILIPNVFIYLKMDNCTYTGPYPWEKIFNKKITISSYFKDSHQNRFKNYVLKNFLIKNVDLFSVEDDESKEYFEKQYSFFENKIITVYNGHVIDLFRASLANNINKKDIILTVSNLGTYSKATDILLEAFAKISDKNNWELHLAGTIDETFKPYIDYFFKKYSNLKERIFFHGHLSKEYLFHLYQKSKIFCLPSHFEGFAIVYPEAMYFKNAIITTYFVSPRKIINNNCGFLIDKDDVKGLADALLKLINNEELLNNFGNWGYNFAKNNLNWDKICQDLLIEMYEKGFTN